jgi:ABC-type transport system involved in cytochrome bd biosynthesis fused ATPase/permease subunit
MPTPAEDRDPPSSVGSSGLRFSTVRDADRIYVMRDGEIVEHGSHIDLLKHDGVYAEMFSLQATPYR